MKRYTETYEAAGSKACNLCLHYKCEMSIAKDIFNVGKSFSSCKFNSRNCRFIPAAEYGKKSHNFYCPKKPCEGTCKAKGCPVRAAKEKAEKEKAAPAKKGRKSAANEAHQILAASNKDYQAKMTYIKKAAGPVEARELRGISDHFPGPVQRSAEDRPPTPVARHNDQHDAAGNAEAPQPRGQWVLGRDDLGTVRLVQLYNLPPVYNGPLTTESLQVLDAVNARKSRRNDKTVEKSAKKIQAMARLSVGSDLSRPDVLLRVAKATSTAAHDDGELDDENDREAFVQLINDNARFRELLGDTGSAAAVKRERPCEPDERNNALPERADSGNSGLGDYDLHDDSNSDDEVVVINVGHRLGASRPKTAAAQGGLAERDYA